LGIKCTEFYPNLYGFDISVAQCLGVYQTQCIMSALGHAYDSNFCFDIWCATNLDCLLTYLYMHVLKAIFVLATSAVSSICLVLLRRILHFFFSENLTSTAQ